MHPEMYAAYPELRAIDIDARYNSALRSPNGAYVANAPGNGGRSKIELQANSLEGPHNSVRGMGLHEMQHAIQSAENFVPGSNPNYGHAIEDQWAAAREAYEESKGLAGGMSDDELLAELTGRTFEKKPTKSWDELTKREQLEWLERGRGRLYHHNAGEVEARNVQSRMNLTPAQRRETPPWETQDVPDELQIIRHR